MRTFIVLRPVKRLNRMETDIYLQAAQALEFLKTPTILHYNAAQPVRAYDDIEKAKHYVKSVVNARDPAFAILEMDAKHLRFLFVATLKNSTINWNQIALNPSHKASKKIQELIVEKLVGDKPAYELSARL